MLGHAMPHSVDVHVGKRIRQRRWLIGMTQQKLADLVGIKFQQIQKYETGANRVSASRLWDIGEAMGVPAAFFFDGLKEPEASPQERANVVPTDLLSDKEAMELVRSYYAIPENQRRRLFELARVLSDVA
jgi:transcriptional regulator with XRE-family HTH domain